MKKKFITFTILLFFSMFAFSQNIIPKDFSTQTVEGKAVTFADFQKAEITMLNIWGTFCSPCIREMPDLAELSNKYQDRNFQIIGIVLDVTNSNGNINQKKLNEAKNIISLTNVSYKNLVPTKNMIDTFLHNIYVVPNTFFIDKNGNQIGDEIFGSKSKNKWEKIIDEKLKLVE